MLRSVATPPRNIAPSRSTARHSRVAAGKYLQSDLHPSRSCHSFRESLYPFFLCGKCPAGRLGALAVRSQLCSRLCDYYSLARDSTQSEMISVGDRPLLLKSQSRTNPGRNDERALIRSRFTRDIRAMRSQTHTSGQLPSVSRQRIFHGATHTHTHHVVGVADRRVSPAPSWRSFTPRRMKIQNGYSSLIN